MVPAGADVTAWTPELRAEAARTRSKARRWLPVWVRGLEAWADGAYPPGAYGRSAAQHVVAEVVEHYRQEHMLRTLAGRRCTLTEDGR